MTRLSRPCTRRRNVQPLELQQPLMLLVILSQLGLVCSVPRPLLALAAQLQRQHLFTTVGLLQH